MYENIINKELKKYSPPKKSTIFKTNAQFSKECPDLKRAQRTSLSAQSARRTKSRGPKGLQLEVRPWRGT